MKRVNLLYLGLLLMVGCAQQAQITPMQTTLLPGRAVVCSSNNVEAKQFYNIAHTASQEGAVEKAKEYYLKAIKADSQYCDAMDNLARIYRQQGQYQDAIALYQKSLSIEPVNSVALLNLAVVYKNIGDTDHAIEQYIKLKTIDADDPESYYGLGVLYFNLENYDKALENMDVALNIYLKSDSPYTHQAQYIIGASYFKLGNCAESQRYLLNSYSELNQDPKLNYYLGLCYLTRELFDRIKASKFLAVAEESGAIIPDKIRAVLNSETETYISLTQSETQKTDKNKVISFTKLLESEPFHPQAAAIRSWLIDWITQTQDLTVSICRLLGPIPNDDIPFSSELFTQMIFANASYQISENDYHSEAFKVQFASVISVLKTYISIKNTHPEFSIEYFDDLLNRQKENTLEMFYQPIISNDCQTSS
jgi:tetratricopeptide (TPR) repeat protein